MPITRHNFVNEPNIVPVHCNHDGNIVLLPSAALKCSACNKVIRSKYKSNVDQFCRTKDIVVAMCMEWKQKTVNSFLPNTYISAAKCATPDPEEELTKELWTIYERLQNNSKRANAIEYFNALKTKQEQTYKNTKTASVYQVKYNERYYALKALRTYETSYKSDGCKYVKSERDILESFRKNPFIIRLHAAMQDSQRVYFLLEYAPCGGLRQYFTKYKLDEESVKWFSGQIICAINYLHSKSIIHRGLNGFIHKRYHTKNGKDEE
ncbi:unnamed protein product [Rotaria socialis]|uniref:Protein kinase domain-containing protein n=1 Tax=Rotaria socialis TaxID=392032 RepID=A0A821CXM2_9BILA|nr:unnamed protein product [Rotaria socialis]